MSGDLTVLLIDDCPERVGLLKDTLSESGYHVVAVVEPGLDLYRVFARYEPDIVIVDMDSPDRDTFEHMRSISSSNPRPIVMFASDDDQATIKRAVASGVSAYVVDNLSTRRVRPVIDAAIARFEQFQSLRTELDAARTSLEERKIIEKAKGVLMQRKNLDEPAAYRAMQKMAMDRNCKLVDLAKSLIAAAELLT